MGVGNCLGCDRHFELDLGNKEQSLLTDIAARISARGISMILVLSKGLMPSCYIGGVGGMNYLAKAQHIAKNMKIPFPPLAFWRPHDRYLGLGQLEALLEYNRICRYLDSNDYPAAKDMLRRLIFEANDRVSKIQESKKKAIEAWKKSPADELLKEEVNMILKAETKMRKNSNISSLSSDLVSLGKIPRTLDLIPSIIDYATCIGLKETSDQWLSFLNNNGDLRSDVTLESILSRDGGLPPTVSKGLFICFDELKLINYGHATE
jgi:hypothetical protein